MQDEREQDEKRGFTVTDKRGQNNPIQEPIKPQSEIADSAPVNSRTWRSVGYRIIIANDQNHQPLILGQAAGLANDEETFTVAYLLVPSVEPGDDWTIDARRRLNTYLTCQCSLKVGVCGYHRRAMGPNGWMKDDAQRLKDSMERPVPEVFEILFKAERTRDMANKILTPKIDPRALAHRR